jgi:glycosyltransferase involved in cell wall biosynthesis
VTERRGLGLFFTLGVSLTTWQEYGLLEHELAYYRRLGEALGGVTWITYGGKEDARLAETLDGVRVLHNRWGLDPHDFARQAARLYHDELRGLRVVKTNQLKGADAAIRAKRTSGAKLVTRGGYVLSRFRGSEGYSLRHRLGRWRLEAAALWLAERVLLPTPADVAYAQRVYGLPARRITLLPNFVMTDLFTPRPDVPHRAGLIGFVGRLAEQKNLGALIEAAAGLEGVSLRLIGDGPLRESLQAQAEAAGLSAEFTGRVPHREIPRLLAECQVFVLPSFYEGHPKALIEAMACGLPVVGTPVDGTSEVLRDGQNGLLAADTSAPALRAALAHLLADANLRERLGRAARVYAVENYALERVLDIELNVYREIGVL